MPLHLAIMSLMNFSDSSFRGKVEAKVRSHKAEEYRNQCKGKKETSNREGEREKDIKGKYRLEIGSFFLIIRESWLCWYGDKKKR